MSGLAFCALWRDLYEEKENRNCIGCIISWSPSWDFTALSSNFVSTSPFWMPAWSAALFSVTIVIDALGTTLPEQKRATKRTAKAVVDFIRDDYQVVISHSNGPQVGMIHTAMSEFFILCRNLKEKIYWFLLPSVTVTTFSFHSPFSFVCSVTSTWVPAA